MVEIQNIVASGSLEREFDLSSLVCDLNLSSMHYNPEEFPGLQVKFKDKDGLLTLFSSGSITIMGAKNKSDVDYMYDELIRALKDLEIDIDAGTPSLEIQNIVCKDDLGSEVNLNTLALGLGIEHIEYEPEQSPFLYYWPSDYDCLVTIPSNGQIIVTGVQTVEEAKHAIRHVKNETKSIVSQSVYRE